MISASKYSHYPNKHGTSVKFVPQLALLDIIVEDPLYPTEERYKIANKASEFYR